MQLYPDGREHTVRPIGEHAQLWRGKSSPAALASAPHAMPITEPEVKAAMERWGSLLVEACASSAKSGAGAVAEQFVDRLYGFDVGSVSFKPTSAVATATGADGKVSPEDLMQDLKTTREQVVAYFVDIVAKPLTAFRVVGAHVTLLGPAASVMAVVAMTIGGRESGAEVSFVYSRAASGDLKIRLHHQSFAYRGGNPYK